MASYARLSVSISKEQMQRLRERADAEGTDISSVVRSALDWWELTGGNLKIIEEVAVKHASVAIRKRLAKVMRQFGGQRHQAGGAT